MKFKFLPIVLFLINSVSAQVVYNRGSMTDMASDNFSPKIKIDTIQNKKNLFGMGPYGKMQGEITIVDGKPLYAVAGDNEKGQVAAGWNIEAPFFVYANVPNWTTHSIESNSSLKSLHDIQKLIEETAVKNGQSINEPFPFRIVGTFNQITTHIVTPRDENIKGFIKDKNQINYDFTDITGELLGFYSPKHQGIFTGKGSNIHVHFVKDDMTIMGHLDKINQESINFKILFPEKNKVGWVNDTDFSKGRLGNIQKITLDDLQKFHGHLCDGLIEGYLALSMALNQLYPDGIWDRTNTRIISKPSPCITDAAVYMTGGRYQFNTFYVDNDLDGLYQIQRIDNQKSVLIKRKKDVKPFIIDQMGNKAIAGNLAPCDIDQLRILEDQYSQKLLSTPPTHLFEIIDISPIKWKSTLKKTFVKTDILNKNMVKCSQ